MAKQPREKEPVNIVHQNDILCETIRKEVRNQKLYTNYSVNPYKKSLTGRMFDTPDPDSSSWSSTLRIDSALLKARVYTLAGKPNSYHDSADGEEDETFLRIIHRASEEPVKKYLHPQTEAQEYGWIHKPLVKQNRGDRRLHFPRQNSEITKYMDAAWRLKEQTENMQ